MLIEVVLFILLIYIIYIHTRKPDDLPPGSFGLPLIGILPKSSIHEFVKNVRKKYGDIACVKLGSRTMVYLSNYNLIKTAFSHPSLQGRPDFFTLQLLVDFENDGIIESEGVVWSNGRRFALRHLRDLGLGKSRLEDAIQLEATALMNSLKKSVGQPTEMTWSINVAVLNVIWNLIASKRFDVDDPEIQHFSQIVQNTFIDITGPALYLDIMPWLIPLVPSVMKSKWMRIGEMKRNRDILWNYLTTIAEEHQKKLDPDSPKDYIDMYLIEMEARKDDPESTFRTDLHDLKAQIADLFFAGSDTVSQTLRWFISYMAIYPNVQKKIQEEIDRASQNDNSALTIQNKESFPYLEATINEAMRKASLLPLGVPHCTTEEMTLIGYRIPKGALIVAFLEACHYSKTHWERPEEFWPEHFLDENGKFMNKNSGFAPFLIGRRSCLGESLAKMELFVFCLRLLDAFEIKEVPEAPIDMTVDRSNAIFNWVKPYKVLLQNRKKEL